MLGVSGGTGGVCGGIGHSTTSPSACGVSSKFLMLVEAVQLSMSVAREMGDKALAKTLGDELKELKQSKALHACQ